MPPPALEELFAGGLRQEVFGQRSLARGLIEHPKKEQIFRRRNRYFAEGTDIPQWQTTFTAERRPRASSAAPTGPCCARSGSKTRISRSPLSASPTATVPSRPATSGWPSSPR